MLWRSVSLFGVVAVGIASVVVGLSSSTKAAGARLHEADQGAVAKASIWMAPNGSDAAANCKRAGTPGPVPDPSGATVCSTLGKAFALSRGGDVIGVLPGDYPAQSVSGAKTAPGVIVNMGITGTRATFANVNIGSSTSWLTLANGQAAYGWERSSSNVSPDHITFRNISTRSVVFINGGSNVSIVGGEIGPVALDGDGALVLEGIPSPLTSVLVSGVRFHDVTRSAGCLANQCHAEVVRIDDGASGIVFAGNTFERGNDPNSATIFLGSKTGNNQMHDLVLRNNFFGEPGSAYYSLNENLSGGCKNITLEYNTFASGAAALLGANGGNCGALSNVVARGNLGAHIAGCPSGIDYSHNVWTDGKCGSTDRAVRDAGFAADGFHITANSPARGAGDPTSAPATDIDGDTRPRHVAPDAGADQEETAALVLGQRIGGIGIGASQDSVRASYGNPRSSARQVLGAGGPRVAVDPYQRLAGTLWVAYDGTKVVAVGTTSPYYSTAAGIGVGSATVDSSGKLALGRSTCPNVYRRTIGGVLVTFATQKNAVRSISMIAARYAGAVRCPHR